jgi:hypothetical protein
MAFSIETPRNIMNLCGNWLRVLKKYKAQIRVGLCALLWVIWIVRNDYF